jgi:hypothetical protein
MGLKKPHELKETKKADLSALFKGVLDACGQPILDIKKTTRRWHFVLFPAKAVKTKT